MAAVAAAASGGGGGGSGGGGSDGGRSGISDGVWIFGQHGALPSQRPEAFLVSDTMRNQCYLILSGDSSAIFPRVTRVITPSPESAFGS